MSRRPGRPRKNNQGPADADTSATSKNDGTGNENTNTSRQGEESPRPVETSADAGFDPSAATVGYTEAIGVPPETAPPGASPSPDAPRRGRPPGSRNSRANISIGGMETLLVGIHATMTAAFSIPEFEMSKEEAHQISEAWAETAKYYPVLNFDPAVAAPINLATTLCIVYGSRIAAFKIRKNAEHAQARQRIPQNNPAPLTTNPPTPAPQQHPPPGVTQQDIDRMPMPPAPTFMNGSGKEKSAPRDIRTGIIAGVGAIEFPPDHPLVSGRKQ